MADYERGPDELAARFRIKPTKPTTPAKRYPRKAIRAKLAKRLADKMAGKSEEEEWE